MYAENIDDCPLRLRVDTECMVARSAVIELPGAAVTHGLSVKFASHNNITTPLLLQATENRFCRKFQNVPSSQF